MRVTLWQGYIVILPARFDTLDLKEAKALLDELA